MENLINIINQFSNFLLENNIIEEKKHYIYGFFIDSPYFTRVNFIKSLREENDLDNKTVVELNDKNEEITVIKYSQVNELIDLFGLKKEDEEVKNKVLEYLNILLEYKKHL